MAGDGRILRWMVLCWCLVSTVWINHVTATSLGAPDSACGNMAPQHGIERQTSVSPFSISLSKDNYQPGEKITVTVSGEQKFRGFFVMARHETNNQGAPVGKFKAADGNLRCATKPLGNALTHTNRDEKGPLTFEWTAPPSGQGPLKFWLTVVKDYNTFWVGITSPVLDGEGAPDTGVTQEQNEIPAFDEKTCGETKSCTVGEFFVSWQYDESKSAVNFEMSARSVGYIAIGFSEDTKMGSDSVVACAADSDNIVSVYHSYNDGRSNQALQDRTLGLTEEEGWYDADTGTIRCSFTRAVRSNIDEQFFDLSQEYYLLLATGTTGDLGFIQKHEAIPKVSTRAIDLTDGTHTIVDSKTKSVLLVKIHACLMLAAWVLCASTGIILARYFKNAWKDSTIFKQKVWFQFHRACMITTLLLHVGGFVVIFVHVKDFTEIDGLKPVYLKAHPLMGIIVTGLVIMNPIMALFRCHPGTPNRPYFNWGHWLVGNAAHVAAVVVIFIGMQFDQSKQFVEDWLMWVMVAFVAVHVLTEIMLQINSCSVKPSSSYRKHMDAMEMTPDGSVQLQEIERTAVRLQYWILACYLLVVTGLLATMIVFIWVETERDA